MAETASKADETRGKILDAAAGLFRRQGYAAVSLRAIAASQNMKGGSLYYHFDSKEQIVSEILNTGIDLVRVAVEYAVSMLPPDASHGDIIRTAARVHLSALLDYGDYTAAGLRIFADAPQSVQDANQPHRDAYDDCWKRLLEDARRDGALRRDADLDIARLSLIGTMNAAADWFDPAQGSVDQLARRLADHFLYGVLVR